MDRSLDEILAERQRSKSGGPSRGNRGPRGSGNGGGGSRRRERQDYPRDGIRKQSYQRDEPRNLDSEWVHDKFEENDSRHGMAHGRRRDSPAEEPESIKGTKIRVENIHYDLTEDDLDELFSRIGPIVNLKLLYDRSGRSEGIAFVTYENFEDASRAVREYDRANAAGQPIRLYVLPSGSSRPARNPFEKAVKPSRPLSERITLPVGRSRSLSPDRTDRLDEEMAARKGIDRYIPASRGSRSRSPYAPARRQNGGGSSGGRRPAVRREQRSGRQGEDGNGPKTGRDGRPRKTQEELDAEMDDYFGGGGGSSGNGNAAAPANGTGAEHPGDDDIDMIS